MTAPLHIATSFNDLVAATTAERSRKFSTSGAEQDFSGLLASLQAHMFPAAKTSHLLPGTVEPSVVEEQDSKTKAFDMVASLIDEIVAESMLNKRPMGVDVNLGPYGEVSVKMRPQSKQLEIQLHAGRELEQALLQPGFLKGLEAHGLESVKIHSRYSGSMTLLFKSEALADATSETRQIAALKKVMAEFMQDVKNQPHERIAYFMTQRSLGDFLVQQKDGDATVEIGVSSPRTKALLNKHLDALQSVSQLRVKPVNLDTLLKSGFSFDDGKTGGNKVAANQIVTVSPFQGAGDAGLDLVLEKLRARGLNVETLVITKHEDRTMPELQKQIQPFLKQLGSDQELEEKSQPVGQNVKSRHTSKGEHTSGGMFFSDSKTDASVSLFAKNQKAGQDSLEGGFKQLLAQTPGLMPQTSQRNVLKSAGMAMLNSSQMLETIQRISDMVKMQGSFSGQKLGVQMDVQNLGRVAVDAMKRSDKIDLHIRVDTPEARRLLEIHLKSLVEQMSKDGVTIGKLDVSVRDDRAEAGAHNPQPQNRTPLGDQFLHAHGRELAEVKHELLSPQLRHKQTGNQTVEIWA